MPSDIQSPFTSPSPVFVDTNRGHPASRARAGVIDTIGTPGFSLTADSTSAFSDASTSSSSVGHKSLWDAIEKFVKVFYVAF